MADKESYPRFPEKNWWALREHFKRSVPTKVTPKFISTVLSPMDEKSAKTNVYPNLVKLKIIDDDGKPTQRAISWRDDTLYPKVCDEIVKEIYPKELLEACPGPNPERENVHRWFATTLGVGDDAAKRLTSFYIMLINKRIGTNDKETSTSSPVSIKPKSKKAPGEPKKVKEIQIEPHAARSISKATVHIDLQIHISPDSTPELIDRIFSSIKKHLYDGE